MKQIAVVFLLSFSLFMQPFCTKAEEALTIPFDVFIGEKNLGYTPVTYTADSLTFDAPEQIIHLLTDLKTPENLLPLFSRPIQNSLTLEGLGRVDINRDLFKITIEPDIRQLNVRKLAKDEEIDFTTASPSFKQDLLFSGQLSSSQDQAYSLQHNSKAYTGPIGGFWRGSYNKEGGYEINTLAGEYNNGKTSLQLGMLETSGSNMSSAQSFWGATIQPNNQYLYSKSNLNAPLEVFVPERSTVVILRDRRIIYSEILDFGLQEIPTDNFPLGSYDIEIVTNYNEANERRETRFFNNNQSFVPQGKIDWRLSIGQTRDDLDTTGNDLAELYIAKRLNTSSEIALSALQIGNLRLFEPQFRTLFGQNEIKYAFLKSNQNDLAALMELTQYIRNGSWSVTFSKALQGFTGLEDDPLSDTKEYLRFYLSQNIGPLQASFSANKTKNSNAEENFNVGGRLKYNIVQNREHNLSLEGSHFNANNGANSQVGLKYRYKPQNNRTYDSQITHRSASDDSELLLSQRFQQSTQQNAQNKKDYNLLVQQRQSDNTEQRAEVGTNILTDKSRIRATATHQQLENDTNTSLTFSAATSFAFGQDRIIQAAQNSDESQVLVRINGDSGEIFNVLVNNQKMTSLTAGESALINLKAFKTHTLRIEPKNKDNALVYFDGEERALKLHKGQMHYEAFNTRPMVMLFARVFSAQGQPLNWKYIKSPDGSSLIDGEGYMQFEYTGLGALSVENKNQSCTLALPPIPKNQIFYDIGNVLCM